MMAKGCSCCSTSCHVKLPSACVPSNTRITATPSIPSMMSWVNAIYMHRPELMFYFSGLMCHASPTSLSGRCFCLVSVAIYIWLERHGRHPSVLTLQSNLNFWQYFSETLFGTLLIQTVTVNVTVHLVQNKCVMHWSDVHVPCMYPSSGTKSNLSCDSKLCHRHQTPTHHQ